MGKTRRPNPICPICYRPVRANEGARCARCLRKFHTKCLMKVKRKKGRTSYWLCQDCYSKNPDDYKIKTGVIV